MKPREKAEKKAKAILTEHKLLFQGTESEEYWDLINNAKNPSQFREAMHLFGEKMHELENHLREQRKKEKAGNN